MWQVEGKSLSVQPFSPFRPEKVLVDYDGPRSFTLRIDGRLHLAHWCEEDAKAARFLVVPFSDDRLRQFEEGQLTCLEAMSADITYLVDVARTDGAPLQAWEVDARSIPHAMLPDPSVRLSQP